MLLNRRLVALGPPSRVLIPELLLLAYGSQMHLVHNAEGDLVLADSCCGEGRPPVEWLMHQDERTSLNGQAHNPTVLRVGER